VQLLEEKFFDDTKLFQVLDKPVKLVQGGVSGDPEVQKKWKHALIKDDPRLVTNKRGTFAFASSVPNSRTPQFILNLSDNGRMMDGRGPYGMVSLATASILKCRWQPLTLAPVDNCSARSARWLKESIFWTSCRQRNP
jgi:cyclophilin family peptidyl-prolyl cis-trans isomerase